MTTFGISRVLDEADVVETSVRRMVAQVDHVVIGCGRSSDGTREILDSLVTEGLPLSVLDDGRPAYDQADVLTGYAHRARAAGATWVVPYDTDEAWFACEGTIRDRLAELPEACLLARAANLTHCCTDQDDDSDPDPMRRMAWRSAEQLPLGKVACRVLPGLRIGHGNHVATYEGIRWPLYAIGVLESRHFPYRSVAQFIDRVRLAWPQLRAAYETGALSTDHGGHIREYGQRLDSLGPEGLREWFDEHMRFSDPASNTTLVRDPIPEPGDFR